MRILIDALSLVVFVSESFAQDDPEATVSFEAGLVHLRNGETRDWSTCPEQASGKSKGVMLHCSFCVSAGLVALRLTLRSNDV